MKILIDINHPHDVHFFKNAIWYMQNKGHTVLITASDKEFSLYLLDFYKFKYRKTGKNVHGLMNKACMLLKKEYELFKVAKEFNPDILVSASPYLAHVSNLIRKPHIAFADTEHSTLTLRLILPSTTIICTPTCYKRDLGLKQVRYNSNQELAYLHPNHFKPNPTTLNDLKLEKNDKFIILRFVSWNASHDIGQHGFTDKKELIKKLEDYGSVFITSEHKLSKDFDAYRIPISPERIHDLLHYATMYIGEGATMASEAAVLGTPAIYVNTLRLGYTDEEEEKYGLVYNFSDAKTAQKEAFEKVIELLEDNTLKMKWQKKREKMLNEKIDTTEFMVELFEKYARNIPN